MQTRKISKFIVRRSRNSFVFVFETNTKVLLASKTTVRGLQAGRLKCRPWRKALVLRVRQSNLKGEASKARKKDESGKTERTKAYQFGRALADACCGFATFKKHNTVKLLGPDEVRYQVDRKRACPFDVPGDLPSKRSCISDRKTKQKDYDLSLPDTTSGSLCW